MSKKEQRHVVPTKDGKWANKKAGSKRASSVSNTQAEARSKAIEQAKKHGNTEVKVHGKNGRIRESNTYTRKNDPKKPKG